jgi:hypothetical protein
MLDRHNIFQELHVPMFVYKVLACSITVAVITSVTGVGPLTHEP